jgi:RNA polymerase sigma-70 factor (ECF subfamily)
LCILFIDAPARPRQEETVLEKRPDSLIGRLRAGDHTAASELVDKYYEQIYLFFRRLGHNCQVSEDLTQESFLAAWQHICQLRNGRALNSWLYRIASNISKGYWRNHRNFDTAGIEQMDLPDGSQVGSDQLEHIEELNRLRNAVVKLPAKLRQAVVLHYMQHLTIAEAAETAGVREGTFKSRLHRALRALGREAKYE